MRRRLPGGSRAAWLGFRLLPDVWRSCKESAVQRLQAECFEAISTPQTPVLRVPAD